jgi:hypothetical protein
VADNYLGGVTTALDCNSVRHSNHFLHLACAALGCASSGSPSTLTSGLCTLADKTILCVHGVAHGMMTRSLTRRSCLQAGKGALLLDSVPYGRSGDWAVSVWVRFGNLFGNGAVAGVHVYTKWHLPHGAHADQALHVSDLQVPMVTVDPCVRRLQLVLLLTLECERRQQGGTRQ